MTLDHRAALAVSAVGLVSMLVMWIFGPTVFLALLTATLGGVVVWLILPTRSGQ